MSGMGIINSGLKLLTDSFWSYDCEFNVLENMEESDFYDHNVQCTLSFMNSHTDI